MAKKYRCTCGRGYVAQYITTVTQVVRAMDKLGRPADKMRVKKVLEEFYR